jgi:deoxyribonuclease IV
MNIGCHVSIAGGIQNAPERASLLGAEAMQIFTRPPQGGKAPELTKEIISDFKLKAKSYKLEASYIHAPYYINFASANNRIRYGSVSVVRNELERASLLGARYVMTHLGSAGELSEKEATEKVIEMLKKTLDGYSGSAQLLIENSAGAGKIIGATFAQIAEIVKKVDHPSLTGVCMDTQHSFASGYDWCDFEKTIKKIDSEIGFDKIKLIHANDSLVEFSSHKDRHQHIGQGKIGLDCFVHLVNFAKEKNIDMILETEHDAVKEDIEILKKLRG